MARLEKPEGADPALWTELRSSLATMLASDEAPLDGPALPLGPAGCAAGFALEPLGAGSFNALANWEYRSVGDYDQDGTVRVNDLTMIALYFNYRDTDEHWSWAAPVDGNGDGRISALDLTAIGANFGRSFDAWRVEWSASGDASGYWTTLGQMNIEARRTTDGFRRLELELADARSGYYRLRPVRAVATDGLSALGAAPQLGLSGPAVRYVAPAPSPAAAGWVCDGGNAQNTGASRLIGPATLDKLHFMPLEDQFGEARLSRNELVVPTNGDALSRIDFQGRVLDRIQLGNPDLPLLVLPGSDLVLGTAGPALRILLAAGGEQDIQLPGMEAAQALAWSDALQELLVLTSSSVSALSLSGALQWERQLSAGSQAAQLLAAPDGRIAVLLPYPGNPGSSSLLILDSQGQELWTYTTEATYSQPELSGFGPQGITYLLNEDLRALGADGKLLWRSGSECSNVLVSGNNVYVCPVNHGPDYPIDAKEIVKYSYKGQELWHVSGEQNHAHALAVDDQQRLWWSEDDRGLMRAGPDSGGSELVSPEVYADFASFGGDGNLYAVWAGQLYSCAPDGQLRWLMGQAGYYSSPLSIDSAGGLYYDGVGMHACDHLALARWHTDGPSDSQAAPLVCMNGDVVSSSYVYHYYSNGAVVFPGGQEIYHGYLRRYSASGQQLWVYSTGYGQLAAPREGNYGTIYTIRSVPPYADVGFELIALNPAGAELWRIPLCPADAEAGSLAVWPRAAGDLIYCVIDKELRCYSETGSLFYATAVPEATPGALDLLVDDTGGPVYVDGSGKQVFSVAADGTRGWSYRSESAIGDICMTAGGPLCALQSIDDSPWSAASALLALDVESGTELWRAELPEAYYSNLAVDAEGTVYAASYNNVLRIDSASHNVVELLDSVYYLPHSFSTYAGLAIGPQGALYLMCGLHYVARIDP